MFRKVTNEDIIALSANLREQDRIEVEASSGLPPLEAIKKSVECSSECHAIELDGNLLAIFGVSDLGEGIGSPWMLGTEELSKNARRLLKHGQAWIDTLDRYNLLINYVHADNDKSIRWLKWMGFVFLRPVYTKRGDKFYEFVRIRNV